MFHLFNFQFRLNFQSRPATTMAEASTGLNSTAAASDVMLRPYAGLHIITSASKKKPSTYRPSSLMMDYIIHQTNDLLVDHPHFRRSSPDYHPYILRLYYGILFWIQCLRAAAAVQALNSDQHQTLTRFLSAFPPDSLTISSPLLYLFKTLCSSPPPPENPSYGKVYPLLPSPPGPTARSAFMSNSPYHYIIPNIPGILALLSDLNSTINDSNNNPVYPGKGKHVPVADNRNEPVVFAHHRFPPTVDMTDKDRWMLASSGLQYPCEADEKLHKGFAQRYENFSFPTAVADDDEDLSTLERFFSTFDSLSWFARVREVAAVEAAYFEGSGTLADCSPSGGIVSNQIVVAYQGTSTPPIAPTHSFDTRALFPFSIRLHTTVRSIPELAEAMAAFAQTNISMFATHPWLHAIDENSRDGPFWQIRPVEKSSIDQTSYLSLKDIIRGLIRHKSTLIL
ncbi:hypothetical protein ABFS82_11G070400 [Erythranthe guttata]|nr:PREDICTED: uncharacterized protein LOC105970884 [Erythranthe guttata]|eukprot:XP_012851155.1 PREDICTED: uncharacterized protein LOC105970884 [Erythranthe guttata]